MAARKLSIGDTIVAHAALTKIVEKAAEDQEFEIDEPAMAKAILSYAADVHYKPVTGALTLTFDLSGTELVPTDGGD